MTCCMTSSTCSSGTGTITYGIWPPTSRTTVRKRCRGFPVTVRRPLPLSAVRALPGSRPRAGVEFGTQDSWTTWVHERPERPNAVAGRGGAALRCVPRAGHKSEKDLTSWSLPISSVRCDGDGASPSRCCSSRGPSWRRSTSRARKSHPSRVSARQVERARPHSGQGRQLPRGRSRVALLRPGRGRTVHGAARQGDQRGRNPARSGGGPEVRVRAERRWRPRHVQRRSRRRARRRATSRSSWANAYVDQRADVRCQGFDVEPGPTAPSRDRVDEPAERARVTVERHRSGAARAAAGLYDR